MHSTIPVTSTTYLTSAELSRELRISPANLAKKLRAFQPDALLRCGQRQFPLYREGRFTSVPAATNNV